MDSYDHPNPRNLDLIHPHNPSHKYNNIIHKRDHTGADLVGVLILCNFNKLHMDNLSEHKYHKLGYRFNQRNNNHHHNFSFHELLNHIYNYDDDNNNIDCNAGGDVS